MKKLVTKLSFIKSIIITFTTSLILSLLALNFFFYLNSIDPTSTSVILGFTILSCSLWVALVFIMSYALIGLCIFNLPEKKAKEEVMKKFNLTKEKYIDVHYCKSTVTNDHLVFLLLMHSEFYFYAKLNENEKVHLIVKNKTGDYIYCNTVRFRYFNAYFKKI